jgi:hypothetical protein
MCLGGQPPLVIGGWQYPFRLASKAQDTANWLDHVLGEWLDARDEDDESDLEWDPTDPDNMLVHPEQSWRRFVLCAAFDWQHLPEDGGIDDQDDAFLHDAAIIAKRMSQLRTAKKKNKERRKEAERRLQERGPGKWLNRRRR